MRVKPVGIRESAEGLKGSCAFRPPSCISCLVHGTMVDMQGMILRTRVLLAACFLAILTLVLGLAWAQQIPPAQPSANAMPIDVDRGAAGLTRWLHALRTRASVLMITAHPDDEDGGMLAF